MATTWKPPDEFALPVAPHVDVMREIYARGGDMTQRELETTKERTDPGVWDQLTKARERVFARRWPMARPAPEPGVRPSPVFPEGTPVKMRNGEGPIMTVEDTRNDESGIVAVLYFDKGHKLHRDAIHKAALMLVPDA